MASGRAAENHDWGAWRNTDGLISIMQSRSGHAQRKHDNMPYFQPMVEREWLGCYKSRGWCQLQAQLDPGSQLPSEPSLHPWWLPSPTAISFLYATSSPNIPNTSPNLPLQMQPQSLGSHSHPWTSHNGHEYSDWPGQGSLCTSKGLSTPSQLGSCIPQRRACSSRTTLHIPLSGCSWTSLLKSGNYWLSKFCFLLVFPSTSDSKHKELFCCSCDF